MWVDSPSSCLPFLNNFPSSGRSERIKSEETATPDCGDRSFLFCYIPTGLELDWGSDFLSQPTAVIRIAKSVVLHQEAGGGGRVAMESAGGPPGRAARDRGRADRSGVARGAVGAGSGLTPTARPGTTTATTPPPLAGGVMSSWSTEPLRT